MAADTADIIRHAAAAAKAQDAGAAVSLAKLPPASKRLSMTVPIGTAVLDLVTGEKGVVIDGQRSNVIVSPATNAGS